jgi:hypothetical protein
MSHGARVGPNEIVIEPGLSDGEVTFRVAPNLVDDLRELLDENKIHHGRILEFSQTSRSPRYWG